MNPIVIAADVVSVTSLGISLWAVLGIRADQRAIQAARARIEAANSELARLRAARRKDGAS